MTSEMNSVKLKRNVRSVLGQFQLDGESHNLDRGRTQLRLEELIEEQEEHMNKLVDQL